MRVEHQISGLQSFRLRAATREDAGAIADVMLASRRHSMPYLANPHTDDDVRRWIGDVLLQDSDVTVAVAGDCVIGVCAARSDFIEQFYVVPHAQSHGVGNALLAAAKTASPGGLKLYVFQRNANARAFYEKHGFVLVSLQDGSNNEEQEPDALYEWRVQQGARS